MIVRKCIAVVRHKIIAKLFIGPCISIKQIYCRRDTLQTGISSLNTNLRERNVVDYTLCSTYTRRPLLYVDLSFTILYLFCPVTF